MRQKNEMDTLVSRKPPAGAGPRKMSKESRVSHKVLITRNLKLVYEDIAKEDLPEKLQTLLDQIEDGERKS